MPTATEDLPFWAVDDGEDDLPSPSQVMGGLGDLAPMRIPALQSDPTGSAMVQSGIVPPIPQTAGQDFQEFLREPGRIREEVGAAMINLPEMGLRATGLRSGQQNVITPEMIGQREKALPFTGGQSVIPGEPNALKNLATPGLATLATPAAPLAALSYLTDIVASIPDLWKEATDPSKSFEEKGRFITENLAPLAIPFLGHKLAPEMGAQIARSLTERSPSIEPLTTGTPNAERILSNQKEPAQIGQEPQGVEVGGGGDLQQAPPRPSSVGVVEAGKTAQEVIPAPASTRPFFDRASEAQDLGRPSERPTVEDVRRQRAQDESATTSPAAAEIKQTADLPGNDFINQVKVKQGGLTGDAWRLGRSVTTEAELQSLKDSQAKVVSEGKALMKAGKLDEAMPAIMKGQYFREAYEAATGTGGGGEHLRKNVPDYKPPFPDGKSAAAVARPAASAPIAAEIKQLDNLPINDFIKRVKTHPNGLSGDAMRLGRSVTTAEDLQSLKDNSTKALKESQALMDAENFDDFMSVAMRGQYFREAYEAATGTGGAGDFIRQSEPNYKPPFPEGGAAAESPASTRPFFNRQSEMQGGAGGESLPPTVADVRRVRAQDEAARTAEAAGVETAPLDPQSGQPLPPAAREQAAQSAAGDPNVTGLAERVRAQREAAGMTAATEPGQGIAPETSVERGRARLAAGENPEAAMAGFEKTGRLNANDIEIARAQTEILDRAVNEAETKFGPDSKEWKAAFKEASDWSARTKTMQTEWAKQGHAQQGQVDIDTGTFTGLARAFKEDTGKDFTPQQVETAKKTATRVKQADTEATTAKEKLYDQLDKETGGTAAEKKALAAASKTVREAAARLAEAENKSRVAKAGTEKEVARVQEIVAQRALDAANKTVREAAVKLADAENRARVRAAEVRPEDVQEKAAKEALAAASETVRKAATRLAEAENKARVAEAGSKKKAAEAEAKAAKKFSDAASKRVREAAIKAADAENKARVARADAAGYAWTKAKEYIEAGMDDFNDIRNKLATDMGISVDKVTAALAKVKGAKYLTDELWRKQQTARNVKQQAKQWLRAQAIPGYVRALQMIPRAMFGLKVGFHGTVALGTHAPMVAFQPTFWKTYVRDFAKMYKMVGSKVYYENQVQDLVRRPNYTTANRAGLVNDPFTYEDFNSPDTAKYFAGMTGMGNRGYSVLKIIRQDMFDQQWNQLPKTAQVPEVAQAVADGLNHATGVVKGSAPTGSNLLLFAPRLAASRVAWLAVDPVKAAMSVADWKNATQAEKIFAINQVKEKAWVAGTMFGLLALNQGFLSATGSDQKVNMTDPMKSDFLKFKIHGMTASYGNAMISMARLPVRLYEIRQSDGGKQKNLVHADESSYSVLGEYGRTQLSPFASLASTLWFKSDWQNRPLPNSTAPVPKRQRLQGVKPYTWPEFWSEQVLPIPFEEAVREVWRHGLGMSPDQTKHMREAMATIAVMAATGGRLVEDTSVKEEVPDWAK